MWYNYLQRNTKTLFNLTSFRAPIEPCLFQVTDRNNTEINTCKTLILLLTFKKIYFYRTYQIFCSNVFCLLSIYTNICRTLYVLNPFIPNMASKLFNCCFHRHNYYWLSDLDKFRLSNPLATGEAIASFDNKILQHCN